MYFTSYLAIVYEILTPAVVDFDFDLPTSSGLTCIALPGEGGGNNLPKCKFSVKFPIGLHVILHCR